jgi:microcystin-dependent protein
MAQPFVGQVIAVGFNFAPVGWFLCNGQLLPISQYDVLFNLLGTTYGGDGISTFGLPNMNGRAPLCMGTGSGLSTYVLGQAAGTESVTLLSNQVGLHSHTLATSAKAGTASSPGPTLALGTSSFTDAGLYLQAAPNTTLAGTSIGQAGQGLPHENRQPFVTVNYIIAAFGIYPSQG